MSGNVHFHFFPYFVLLTCIEKKQLVIPFCPFFFTKFTSLFDGIVFLSVQSSDNLKKKSDIFECFKLLNTGEQRGSVWCRDTEGTVL